LAKKLRGQYKCPAVEAPTSPSKTGRGVDRGDGRDVEGKYTGGKGYGAEGEAKGLQKYAKSTGLKVFDKKVAARIQGLPYRYFDGLAKKSDGTYEGIEVKTNTATRDAQQTTFDNMINSGTPARAKLNGRWITITSVALVNWP
jgi:hypothetical protein